LGTRGIEHELIMKETLTLIEKTAFLKGVEALSTIPTEALAELAARAREVHLDAGDVVFREGDANRGTFIVIEGVVALRMASAIVRVAREGMAFGELFLAEGDAHQTTAEAVEHTHVLSITSEDIFDAMMDFPEFGVAVVRGQARHVNGLQSRIVELEGLLGRFHTALRRAGLPAPDAKEEERQPAPDDNG
jgi:CRP-like cAMP-binding protein